MIYRAVIEGSGERLEKMDSFYLFFGASSDEDAKERIKKLTTMLFPSHDNTYEAYKRVGRDSCKNGPERV